MKPPKHKAGFTLIEMLVVMAIIGLLSFLALPAIKNITKSDAMGAANRQLLDDIAYARRAAIRNRTTVYMVFLPHNYHALAGSFTGADLDQATDLLALQYHGYRMFAWRRVGEQPGQSSPTYLTDWRALPEGVFIPQWKYTTGYGSVSNFAIAMLPFPDAGSAQQMALPYIAFDYLGQLTRFDPQGRPLQVKVDEIIPLARGALLVPTDDATKKPLWQAPEVVENPPDNSKNNFNHIRVDWLTGRAKVERPEIP